MPGSSELRPWVQQGLALEGLGHLDGAGGVKGGRGWRGRSGKAELLVKAVLPPPAIPAVATCQNWRGGKNDRKKIRPNLSPSNCVEQETGAT